MSPVFCYGPHTSTSELDFTNGCKAEMPYETRLEVVRRSIDYHDIILFVAYTDRVIVMSAPEEKEQRKVTETKSED